MHSCTIYSRMMCQTFVSFLFFEYFSVAFAFNYNTFPKEFYQHLKTQQTLWPKQRKSQLKRKLLQRRKRLLKKRQKNLLKKLLKKQQRKKHPKRKLLKKLPKNLRLKKPRRLRKKLPR